MGCVRVSILTFGTRDYATTVQASAAFCFDETAANCAGDSGGIVTCPKCKDTYTDIGSNGTCVKDCTTVQASAAFCFDETAANCAVDSGGIVTCPKCKDT